MSDIPDFMPNELGGEQESTRPACNAFYHELMMVVQEYAEQITTAELMGTIEIVRALVSNVIRKQIEQDANKAGDV